ncbi:MAG: hypothetical protein KDD50_11805 [Bdellovibrionales bacterium]|nr:hypothetical protein [Bdellovibrionales bacterium]
MSETLSKKSSFSLCFYGHSIKYWISGILLAILIGYFTTPYMMIASIAYFLLVSGLLIRKEDRVKHARLMMAGMGLDISLVLVLEVLRGAIETTLKFSLNGWQQAHIYCSTAAVVLYIPVFILGRKRLKNIGDPKRIKNQHMRVGLIAFAFRSLGFLLMFSLLVKNP